MLERYFVRPQTVDRIRASWIGAGVEGCVGWLAEHGYAARCVHTCVPMLVAFGEFSWGRGARTIEELPGHVEPFVAAWVVERHRHRRVGARPSENEVRGPIERMLTLAVPGFVGSGRSHRPDPFASVLPDFFEYLVAERGLRPASLRNYQHHLRHFESYLARIGAELGEVSPPILSAFIADRAAAGLARTTLRDGCGVLRVLDLPAVHLLEAGNEVNVIRGWLGHADLSTTNRYAEINTKAKQQALLATEPPDTSAGSRTTPIWRSDEALLNWLASP